MEYDTCLRLKIPFVSVIGNDACWTQIARDQVKWFGDDVGCPLLYTDYDRVVAAIGCKGYKADTPAALAQCLAAASQSRPSTSTFPFASVHHCFNYFVL